MIQGEVSSTLRRSSRRHRLNRVGVERMGRAANLVQQRTRHKEIVVAIDIAHIADHAIDKNGSIRQASVAERAFQDEQDFLGAPHGEGRDQRAPPRVTTSAIWPTRRSSAALRSSCRRPP